MRVWRRFLSCVVFLTLAVMSAAPAWALPALLVDMQTGEVLYARDAGLKWHPASLTKLMTAFVTFDAIARGRVDLDTPVIMSARALKAPPAKVGLPVDTAMTMKDALYFLLVKSANDVAIAIAETVSGSVENFVAEMNANAGALGLTATHYVDPNGLSDEGQTTSARDLAILALTIRSRFPQYDAIFATEAVTLGKARLESQNDLLTHFAGTTGMKTGFICASGLNIVATAERNGRDLMAIILGASSGRERGEETAQLLLKGFSGEFSGLGRSVTVLANSSAPATNMRPLICGKEAKTYVAARKQAFPYGLEGQPSFLQDKVVARTYAASLLGRLRNVPPALAAPALGPGAATATIRRCAHAAPAAGFWRLMRRGQLPPLMKVPP